MIIHTVADTGPVWTFRLKSRGGPFELTASGAAVVAKVQLSDLTTATKAGVIVDPENGIFTVTWDASDLTVVGLAKLDFLYTASGGVSQHSRRPVDVWIREEYADAGDALMAFSQSELVERFQLELGDNLEPLVEPATLYRWLNDGKNRLGARHPVTVTLTWGVGDLGIELPPDFYRIDHLTPSASTRMPSYRIFGRTVRFQDPAGASSTGSASLDYWALYPDVTDAEDFVGEDGEAYALVSYMLHRFYVWLASSRTDYRRYSTITGQNGVRFEDLADVANSHLVDFRESGSIEILSDPVTYFGE